MAVSWKLKSHAASNASQAILSRFRLPSQNFSRGIRGLLL
jgi:hypothetical protein